MKKSRKKSFESLRRVVQRHRCREFWRAEKDYWKRSVRRVFQSRWVPFEGIGRGFFFKRGRTIAAAIWMTGLLLLLFFIIGLLLFLLRSPDCFYFSLPDCCCFHFDHGTVATRDHHGE